MAQQNNQSPSLPLWKRLNEERTGGEWIATINTADYYFVDSQYPDCPIATFMHEFDTKKRARNEHKANAAFTALAVNNLASLAEALDTIMERLGTFTESSAWEPEDQDAYDQAKEALNKISQ